MNKKVPPLTGKPVRADQTLILSNDMGDRVVNAASRQNVANWCKC